MLIIAACGPDGHHGRVEGKIEGINQAQIQAYVDDSVPGDAGRLDTIEIRRGKFSYTRSITQPVILTLLYPNFSSTTFVLEPGHTVRLKGDGNRLGEIEVDGNDDNNLLTEFRHRTNEKSESEVLREAATFIRSHPATAAATILFREHYANRETIETTPTEALLDALKKAQPDDHVVRQLDQRLRPLLATAPGRPLPAFTATDIDGNKVSSADYAGKNLLIVFCSQWDGSFYMMKNSARLLRDQISADRLSMLFIALDNDAAPVKGANTYQPLPGKIIHEPKALASPLVKTLGLRYIGTGLLVGKDGKIKARDIPHTQWTERIQQLL